MTKNKEQSKGGRATYMGRTKRLPEFLIREYQWDSDCDFSIKWDSAASARMTELSAQGNQHHS
jgi:hypothetical protein